MLNKKLIAGSIGAPLLASLLALGLYACAETEMVEPPPPYDDRVEAPPLPPAEVYRREPESGVYLYDYYPAYNVYYNRGLRRYTYWDRDRWVCDEHGPRDIPGGLGHNFIELRVQGDRPEYWHREIHAKYPSSWQRDSYRGERDDRVYGRNEKPDEHPDRWREDDRDRRDQHGPGNSHEDGHGDNSHGDGHGNGHNGDGNSGGDHGDNHGSDAGNPPPRHDIQADPSYERPDSRGGFGGPPRGFGQTPGGVVPRIH